MNLVVEDDDEREVFFASSSVSAVGVQYYNGTAHTGEYVLLVREPSNPYDRNAIRVDNVRNQKVGHISRIQASVLAPLIDKKTLIVEGIIPRPGGAYKRPVDLKFYALQENLEDVRKRLVIGGFILKPPKASVVVSRTNVSDEALSQKDLDEMMNNTEELKKRIRPFSPFAYGIEHLLRSTLFEHQLQGIAFMLDRECTATMPPFWSIVSERGRTMYLNSITNCSQVEKPHSVQGGLLCDDMGLGKSLQIIALMLSHPPAGMAYGRVDIVPNGKIPAAATATSAATAIDLTDSDEDYCRLKLTALRKLATKRGVKGATKLKREELLASLHSLEEHENEAEAQQSAAQPASVHDLSCAPAPVPSSSGNHTACSSAEFSGNKTNLIVCPVSVANSWEDQFATHLAPDVLRICNYSGTGRAHDVNELRQFDVIIVSYHTLVSEFTSGPGANAMDLIAHGGSSSSDGTGNSTGGVKKRSVGGELKYGGLFAMQFHRVVLDEAHIIRNRKTQFYKAVTALKADHRWGLTGTPIQNRADDAQPLFGFLQCEPFNDWSIFNRAIVRPLKSGDPIALLRLRGLFSGIALRRTKQVLQEKLPNKVVELVAVAMSPFQKNAYTNIFRSAQIAVQAAMNSGGAAAVLSSYTHVFECILRLRQCCDDYKMVAEERLKRCLDVLARYDGSAAGAANLSKEDAAALFATLTGSLQQPVSESDGLSAGPQECCICMEDLTEDLVRIIKQCKHIMCERCCNKILRTTSFDAATGRRCCSCPLCRGSFTAGDVLGAAELSSIAATTSVDEKVTPSGCAEVSATQEPPAKIIALMQGLQEMKTTGSDLKAVVFSQFTTYLNTIEAHLNANNVMTSRLDGSMNARKRSSEISRWKLPNGSGAPSVLLVSSRAGGTGLNLTEANYVFMMDPLWNSASEEQAMDRVHRLGQNKAVKIVRFYHANSIEEKIIELQKAKAALGKGALHKLSAEETRQARMAELTKIFEL